MENRKWAFRRQALRLLTPAVLELPAQDRGVSHVRQNLHHHRSQLNVEVLVSSVRSRICRAVTDKEN